jgi:hypothetical protein
VQLTAGSDRQLDAVLKAADGRILNGRPITWSSGDTSVARVSAAGLVIGRTAGNATITATSEGRSGTAQVDVVNPVPAATSLAPAAVDAGVAGFSLTVLGSGFVPASRVTWDGAERPGTYISASELRVEITAATWARMRAAARISTCWSSPRCGSAG